MTTPTLPPGHAGFGAPAPQRANPLRAFARLVLSASALLVGSVATATQAADLRSTYEWKPVKIGGGGWVTGLLVHPTTPDIVYCRTDVGGVYRWQPATSSWQQLITADRMPAAWMNADGSFPGTKRTTAYEVESMALAPSNSNVLLVASGKGGPGVLLKSTDGGQSFTLGNLTTWMAGNAEYRTSTERLAIHPTNPNLVFFGSRKEGLWRSTDGGTTWAQIPASVLPFGQSIVVFNPDGSKKSEDFVGVATVVFDPAVPNRVYASVTLTGIYRSDNSGTTWTRILGPSEWCTKLRTTQGILYAAGVKGFGVRRYDPASGWTNITPTTRIGTQDVRIEEVQEVVTDPANSALVYAVTPGFRQLYRSTNSGGTWTSLATNTNGDSGRAQFRSTFGWKETSSVRTWLSMGALVRDPHRSGRVWFAEGMGVWRSDDFTPTNNSPRFDDISEGIEELVANDIVAMPGGKVISAVWDRLGFLHTDLDRAPNRQVGITDLFNSGWALATTPANPDYVAMVATNHLNFGEVFSSYSLNGGLDWTRFASVTPTGANTPEDLRYGELVVSATNPSHLVWLSRSGPQIPRYSTNSGATWINSSFTGVDSNAYFFGNRRRLAADGAIGGKFYLHQWATPNPDPALPPTGPGRLFVSTDGGASFTLVRGDLPAWTFHSQLKGVPGRANHLWLAQGRDYSPRPDALSRSTDGGATWQNVPFLDQAWAFGYGKSATTGGYPTLFVYGRAAVGAAWGVWRSSDQGATWDRIAEYPLGLFDNVTTVTGDPDIFGRVYIGWTGNSFAYGQPKSTNATPPTLPVASPRAGTYGGPLPVTLASSPGAEIRYTTNGANPATSGILYQGPIVLDRSATLRAIARRTGSPDSPLFTGSYLVVPPATTSTGTATLERWLNQSGPNVANVPFDTTSPGQSITVSSLEAPQNAADRFGQRIRGHITPAVSGLYTFWLASDDSGQFRLSTDDTPANAVTIATVSTWTSYRQWTKFPSQKSARIALAAGNRYYFEARAYDGGAGDHLSVAWRPDTATPTAADIVPGSVLSPWGAASPDPSVFHFETTATGDTQGWTSVNTYTTALATSDERAALGQRSLRAQVAKTDTTLAGPDLRVSNPQDAAGRTATFRVWVPDISGGTMNLTAYSQHGDNWTWTANTITPVRGAWNTVTLNVPASPNLRSLGVTLKFTSPYTGPIYLDAVTY